MKKNIIFVTALLAMVFSCTDDSLDPLQMKKVKKGTILALRGTALENLYDNGVPIAQAAPQVATGTETFDFDAEYLAENANTLSSVDVYVLKGSSDNVTRELLVNIPFSQFKNDGTYPRPWVSVSLKFTDMIAKLGLVSTIPLPQATVDALLTGDYQQGINIECDLNLTDGSKILAADIVASGLFQSDQFYPAMRLNYPMVAYCAYAAGWAATYVSGYSTGNFYSTNVTADGVVANTFHMDNFLGKGLDAYFDLKPSTTPFNQDAK